MDIESIPGLRFSPDRVKLVKLLHIMANGGRLPAYIPIKEYIDVYEDYKIWELMKEKDELYCFMRLKNKTSKSSRINRVTHRGTWKGQNDEKILNGHNHVGSCRSFSFLPKIGIRMKNRMVMHEYRLDGDFKTLHSGYVIVHIKRYEKKDTKVNRQEGEQHNNEQVSISIQASQPPQYQHQDEQCDLQQIQPSQHPEQQHQDEENPLKQFAQETHPLWVGFDWEEDGDIGDMDLRKWEDDLRQLIADEHPQQQRQDEENPLQQFARETHPLWVGFDWEEDGDIGDMDLRKWEDDLRQLIADEHPQQRCGCDEQ